MYHSDFSNAKNFHGKNYRDRNTGDLVEYCSHVFMIYPKWRNDTDYHAGFIPEDKKAFDGFEGVCRHCGEVIMINSDNVFSEEDYNKEVQEIVTEINNPQVEMETKSNVTKKKKR